MYSYNRFCNRTQVFMSTWSKFVKNLSIIETYSQTEKITCMWRWSTPENSFLAFIDELWKTQKIRILNKWNKIAVDIIILHMYTKNHNHMRYSSWDMEGKFIFFVVILGQFLPFTPPPPPPPPNNPDNQNFQRMKKASPGDIIILNLRNKKHNQMMYAYSGMERNRHKFLSF